MKHATYVTFAVAWLKNRLLWDMMLCHWVGDSPHFEGSQFLHLQDRDSEKKTIYKAL